MPKKILIKVPSNPPRTPIVQQKLRYRDFIKDKMALIAFLQLILTIVTILITIFLPKISSWVEDLGRGDSFVIENIRAQIKDEIQTIRIENASSDTLAISNEDANRYDGFTSSVKTMISFYGAHDKTDFKGKNLKHTCVKTKINLADRSDYDASLKNVLLRINNIYNTSILKNDKDYTTLKDAQDYIEEEAYEWIKNDSKRNDSILVGIESIIKGNKQYKYADVVKPLFEYVGDSTNYTFQRDLYEHIIRLNRKMTH